MKKSILLFTIIFVLLSCQNLSPEEQFEKDNTFPKAIPVSQLEKTDFVATLESPFSEKKNHIYAASLLFAWDEIKTEINSPLISTTSQTLELMDNSKNYQGVLNDDEYTSSIFIEDNLLKAEAFFKKNLPFSRPLMEKDLTFDGKEVVGFGFYNENEFTSILYYKNNNDFAIKIQPEDQNHQIILQTTSFSNTMNFNDQITALNAKIQQFRKQRTDRNGWKYYWNMEDEVTIPVIEFNLEKNYEDLIGHSFTVENERHFDIIKAYQRTAFVLNKNGARVESEAEMEAVEEAIDEVEIPKPKKLIFDQPFIIFLQRNNQDYPYFACFVTNRELMLEK